jgi:2-oxoisovalerate dehydrogenase E1 component alpha subunit
MAKQQAPAGTNRPRLSLHVPEPPARPGEAADFSRFPIPEPGIQPRPDEACPASETWPLCSDMIRVLGDDNQAHGPWNPRLSPDRLREILRKMALVRAFDGRMYRAQRQGKTSFYLKCSGEEATSVAATLALDFEDMIFPSYRQQGCMIAREYPILEMVNQIYSNRADKLKGRQLPILYSARSVNFFTISGNLATQLPQATGFAMASAIKGDSKIAAGWVGEGSTAEGDFHCALTFAAVYNAHGGVQRDQQPVGDLELLGHRRRRAGDVRRARDRLRHRRPPCRRQRRARGLCRRTLGRRPRALERRADADRVLHLPRRGPFDL